MVDLSKVVFLVGLTSIRIEGYEGGEYYLYKAVAQHNDPKMTTTWPNGVLACICTAFERHALYRNHFTLFCFQKLFRYIVSRGEIAGGYVRLRRSQPSLLPPLKIYFGLHGCKAPAHPENGFTHPSLTLDTLSVLSPPELANSPLSCLFLPSPQE